MKGFLKGLHEAIPKFRVWWFDKPVLSLVEVAHHERE
jgi:hypothetical protein